MGHALDLVGSIVGILGGLAGLSTYLRSRRRVRIASIPLIDSSGGSSLRTTVVNHGAEPVTITFLGWSVAKPPNRLIRSSRLVFYPLFAWWIDRQHVDGPRYDVLGEDVDTGPITVTLKHGEQHVESIDMDTIAGSLSGDQVAWPMAEDSLEKTWFADRPADVT